eukprot:1161988-Pelagomonas_calceolata.AAC.7
MHAHECMLSSAQICKRNLRLACNNMLDDDEEQMLQGSFPLGLVLDSSLGSLLESDMTCFMCSSESSQLRVTTSKPGHQPLTSLSCPHLAHRSRCRRTIHPCGPRLHLLQCLLFLSSCPCSTTGAARPSFPPFAATAAAAIAGAPAAAAAAVAAAARAGDAGPKKVHHQGTRHALLWS